MLKIKDNVDLKELEKFGFMPRYDEDTGEVIEYYMSTKTPYSFNIKKLGFIPDYSLKDILKRIFKIKNSFCYGWVIYARNFGSFTEINADILYDLIKADLVEKVED